MSVADSVASAVISERHSRAPRWSAGPMPCFNQLKLNLHWRGPRWSAGPLRCRTKACHNVRGLVSALTWFGSVLEAAVGGAPDDASQGCFLTLSLPCLRVCVASVQTCLLVVLEFKSCTALSPVQLKRAGNICVRCAQPHAQTISPI